jgi:hypothetical protein
MSRSGCPSGGVYPMWVITSPAVRVDCVLLRFRVPLEEELREVSSLLAISIVTHGLGIWRDGLENKKTKNRKYFVLFYSRQVNSRATGARAFFVR